MGLTSTCQIFETFSSSLEWISVNRFGASEEQCRTDLCNFLRMCDYFGVPIAQEKTVGASQVVQFGGITLDSINPGSSFA